MWQSAAMRVTGVDPRDETWGIDHPRYRVYFHGPAGASEEFELETGGVLEALAWADREAGARTYVVYACVERDGLGLLRLHGRDPNEG